VHKNRLLYFVGPSGAGKDTLINCLRETPSLSSKIFFVKRQVDRPIHDSSALDVYLSPEGFAKALEHNELAMYWQANNHQYGILASDLSDARQLPVTIINGSRAYAAKLEQSFPGARVVLITADQSIIEKRLLDRNRENSVQIQSRLERSRLLEDHDHFYAKVILNNSSINDALKILLDYIEFDH
jgi:ribose 1,5-bisphosphokinase